MRIQRSSQLFFDDTRLISTAMAAPAPPAEVHAEVESFSDIEPQLMKFLYDQNNPPIMRTAFEALEKNTNIPREKVC